MEIGQKMRGSKESDIRTSGIGRNTIALPSRIAVDEHRYKPQVTPDMLKAIVLFSRIAVDEHRLNPSNAGCVENSQKETIST
jgi:hypothetical protein